MARAMVGGAEFIRVHLQRLEVKCEDQYWLTNLVVNSFWEGYLLSSEQILA